MNCDDFLSTIEAGDDAQRETAREHATGCTTCAATLAVLEEIKTSLAVHEPLPSSARAVWETASRVARPVSRTRPQWAAVSAVAATISVCFAFVMFTRHTSPTAVVLPAVSESEKATTSSSGGSTVIVPDISSQLVQLNSAADSLDEMLKSMSEQVERMEVEREIQVTLSRFDRW